MKTEKTFYLTTTLPYVNADLHIGHALEFIRADAIARYKKLMGFDVYFNSGTDEHGMKIYEKAQEAGKSPQEFVDNAFGRFIEQTKSFGMLEDTHFIRTTDERHEKSAQEFWKKVSENGFIYKKNYKTKYCVGCEEEKTESELVDGKCPIHPDRELETVEEENYFFSFSKFQKPLLDFYENHPNFVIPDFRYNEVKNFVKKGLEDFSISRLKSKMPWGIPVPGDEEHVMYVWFDALVNYISTLGWGHSQGEALGNSQGLPLGMFEKFWLNGTPTQYCGKDNTRFQAIMWQAMLMAAGIPNSHQIIVNGHITGEGGIKMSKSLGNVVDPKELSAEYGVDALRYFLLGEVSSFEDSPFSKERFKEVYNAKLANGLGNLTSRIMKMAESNIERFKEEKIERLENEEIPKEFLDCLEKFEIKEACDFIWAKISEMDKYIQENQPFKVVKTDQDKGKEMIESLVAKLYSVARMLNPILPETSSKIKELVKQNKTPESPLFARKD